ncbi:hypothetical protein ACFOU0_07070 [Salinicoccus sesuvii]|uniref:Uncharacterized protein n=1 Tax=Salinicoccus sesuvii TaxID=868281 RepID=A0ABV7N5G0_9STAP
MANDKDKRLTHNDSNIKGKREEDKVYIEGQNREMIQQKKVSKKNPLVWIMPIIIVLLIFPLIFQQISDGHDEEGNTTSTDGSEEETEPTDGELVEEDESESSEEESTDENEVDQEEADINSGSDDAQPDGPDGEETEEEGSEEGSDSDNEEESTEEESDN